MPKWYSNMIKGVKENIDNLENKNKQGLTKDTLHIEFDYCTHSSDPIPISFELGRKIITMIESELNNV